VPLRVDAVAERRVLVGGRDLCGTVAGACHSKAWPLRKTQLLGFASDELAKKACE
jgi:hypothetical protein